MAICALLSIWNTPTVSALQAMSYTPGSFAGIVASDRSVPQWLFSSRNA